VNTIQRPTLVAAPATCPYAVSYAVRAAARRATDSGQ